MSAVWDSSSPEGRTRALLRNYENIWVFEPLVVLGVQGTLDKVRNLAALKRHRVS